MKKNLLFVVLILLSLHGMAQKKAEFPFNGGRENMTNFFKDSLVVSQEIIQKKATGLVIFKFTADESGSITKMIVYYADDIVLVQPIVDALKKSNHKWVVPDGERANDFVITFSYGFNPPAATTEELQKAALNNIINRRPIVLNNQSTVTNGILLPTIMVNYDVY